MYSSIFKPTSLNDFIGNKEAVKNITNWLLNWTPTQKKCALLSGNCGIGKTLLTELALQTYNVHRVETDNDRNKQHMEDVVKPFTQNTKNVFNKKNALVVEDIDFDFDVGFISCLVECVKNTKIPIICVCNNRYDTNIKPIISHCIDIKMSRPSSMDVCRFFHSKFPNKKVNFKELYDQSNGDIRFMFNTLQFEKTQGTKNVANHNIFETTDRLFWMNEKLDKKHEIFGLNDLHSLMVHENYISNVLETSNTLDLLSKSADCLSDSDLFCSKMYDAQCFEMDNYIPFRIIDATKKCNKRNMMKFTQYIGKIHLLNKKKYKEDVFNVFSTEKETSMNKTKKMEFKKIIKKPKKEIKKNDAKILKEKKPQKIDKINLKEKECEKIDERISKEKEFEKINEQIKISKETIIIKIKKQKRRQN